MWIVEVNVLGRRFTRPVRDRRRFLRFTMTGAQSRFSRLRQPHIAA